jgi:hypothetical protein
MISCNPNLRLCTRAVQPINDGFHIRPASQFAIGTIAQSASQSTMDTIVQLASQFTMKLLPDQPVSLQWQSFLI